MAIDAGRRRVSSRAVDAGMEAPTSRSGARALAAAAAATRASETLRPDAMYTVGTPGPKFAAETAAADASGSLPVIRDTLPRV
jgi:hypothetical protein